MKETDERRYLEAGKIINKRGLKGELKVECLCDTLEVLCSFPSFFLDRAGNDRRKVLSAKTYKGFCYLYLEGVDSAREADRLRGSMLFVDRESFSLPDDRVFIADLIGLPVYDADSKKQYGVLAEVRGGASDLFRVKGKTGDFLIPAVKEFICGIDTEKGIFIRPIPGMIEDSEENR